MFSCLISRLSRICCQFHIQILSVFSGLMISLISLMIWLMNSFFRVVVKYAVVQFLQKRLTEIFYVLLAFKFPGVAWCW